MNAAQSKHDHAMDLADLALAARTRGATREAVELFRQAFVEERGPVDEYLALSGNEPMRSLLCRSAATLAHDCGSDGEALRLIDLGLRGDPPPAIRVELEQLRHAVESSRMA